MSRIVTQDCGRNAGKEEQETNYFIEVTWIAAKHTWRKSSEQQWEEVTVLSSLPALQMPGPARAQQASQAFPRGKACEVRLSKPRKSMTFI